MPAMSTNSFLSGLTQASCNLVLPLLTSVQLPVRTVLYEADRRPAYAFFITSGLASVVTPMLNGGIAEVEVVGNEGIVGSFHVLGTANVPTSCFVQMEATALRIGMSELMHLFATSSEIRTRILELVQQQVLMVSQMAGCNRLHEAEARLARWLLMAQDRTQTEVISLTQEFLAEMLGSQRTTVTMVAGALQRAGLIDYRRGQIRIRNREELEIAACECYAVAKRLYSNLYSRPA